MKKLKGIYARWEFFSLGFKNNNTLNTLKQFANYFGQLRQLEKHERSKGSPAIDYLRFYPILGETGSSQKVNSHYFHQPLWLYRHLLVTQPERHIDIGSQTNMLGYISHHVPLQYVDIRNPELKNVPGYSYVNGSIVDLPYEDDSVTSLSSLHVLEHIGLGRYGDPLDMNGHIKAIKEITRVIRSGGKLYISVPCGRERLEFNAHRIFNPKTIIRLFDEFELISLSGIDRHDEYNSPISLEELSECSFGCGFFEFVKK